MSDHYGIGELSAAYRTGALQPAAWLRDQRAALQALAAEGDNAWIMVASEAQLEAQLTVLAGMNAAQCPLYGIPFAIKDNIDMADWTTTAACPPFAYSASSTARCVDLLLKAGAILMGKTNLDQFATGLVGTRSPFGAVANAFSPKHISGGSSSGSAVVVARGQVAFALGTDTAGSGRVPAGFNNIVGCKPTPGSVSTAGVVPACRTLDCVSIMALTAADAAAVLGVVGGDDAHAPDEPTFHPAARRCYSLPALPRVGVCESPYFIRDDYRTLFVEAMKQLPAIGCAVAPFDLAPFSQVAELLYQGPWTAERYAVAGALMESDQASIDPAVREVLQSAKRYSAVDTFNAHYRLRELETLTRGVWDKHDILMVPTAPNLPTLSEVKAEPMVRNSELGYYTNFVNLLGLSAIAVPAGFTPEGLPFGVTFIAPAGYDWALLAFAARWQRQFALPLGLNLRGVRNDDCVIPTTPPGAVALAVVGAHLSGMPLNHQLTDLGAKLRCCTRTAPRYRLYAMDALTPPKPALVHRQDGAAIEVEVYDMPEAMLGRFLLQIPPPLGLGKIELESGELVCGFICEPRALDGAPDITQYGGWRYYVAAKQQGEA